MKFIYIAREFSVKDFVCLLCRQPLNTAMTTKYPTQVLQPITTVRVMSMQHYQQSNDIFSFPFFPFPQTRLTYLKNMRRLVSELYIRDNCHPFKATVLVWIQLPMWIFMSVALRNFSTGAAHAEGSCCRSLFPPDKFSINVFVHSRKNKNQNPYFSYFG